MSVKANNARLSEMIPLFSFSSEKENILKKFIAIIESKKSLDSDIKENLNLLEKNLSKFLKERFDFTLIKDDSLIKNKKWNQYTENEKKEIIKEILPLQMMIKVKKLSPAILRHLPEEYINLLDDRFKINALVRPSRTRYKEMTRLILEDTSKFYETLIIPTNKKFNYDYLALDLNENFNQEYKKIFEKYFLDCPLYLLQECESESCPITRKLYPKYRNFFEKIVSGKLIDCIEKNKNNNFRYVSFGAGELFQDLIILIKTLEAVPNSRLSIDLIDPYFQYSLKGILLEEDNGICTQKRIQEKLLEAFVFNKEKEELNSMRRNILPIFQFIDWLKHNYPKSEIIVTAFLNDKIYTDYLDKNNLSYPDIIAAMDIPDPDLDIQVAPESPEPGSSHLIEDSFEQMFKQAEEVIILFKDLCKRVQKKKASSLGFIMLNSRKFLQIKNQKEEEILMD